MDTVLGVVIGAVLAGLGKLVFDLYTRAQDRKGIAAAIAGEVSGIIYATEMTKMVDSFEWLANALRSPSPPSPPWNYVDTEFKVDPVLAAYLPRIGTLGGDLPQRIAHFYNLVGTIRLKQKMMASGLWNDAPLAAADAIDSGIAIWKAAEADGRQLVSDLQAFSGIAP